MAWHTLRSAEPGDPVHVFYSGDPDNGILIEKWNQEIDLTPSQRTQLAYLLLTGKKMPKSKEEAAHELTKQFKEKTNT